MAKVFVYGTLLRGCSNHRFLDNKESTLVGMTTMPGFTMHNLGPFPACVPSTNENSVIGEVWEVSEKVFQSLDYLEGYPSFYDRLSIETELGPVWIYVNSAAKNKPIIEGGSWRQHLLDLKGNHE